MTEHIAQTMVEAIQELAARWHRATDENDFTAGRRHAYVQAISLLTQVPFHGVLAALEDGTL